MEVISLRGRYIPLFIYTPLDPNRYSIRLLTIHPSNRDYSDRLVECSLHHVDLGDHPEYLALSYTWGSNTQRSNILVNGKTLGVSSNLGVFLKMISSQVYAPDEPELPYWIDAICINQENLVERSQQVRIMGTIYRNARTTISYIADCSLPKPIFKILQLFEQFCQSIRTFEGRDAAEPYWSYISQLWLFLPARLRDLVIDRVSTLCYASYWSRMWIVQEIMLARHWRIVSSTGEWISGRVLYVVMHYLSQLDVDLKIQAYSDNHGVSTWPANAIVKWTRSVSRPYESLWCGPRHLLGYQSSWQILLEAYQHHECHDAHDKIYGILGLVNGGDQFPVDYQQSLPQLLMEVIRFREDLSQAMNKFHVPPFAVAHTAMTALQLSAATVLADPAIRRQLPERTITYQAHRVGRIRSKVNGGHSKPSSTSLVRDRYADSWEIPIRICQCPCCKIGLNGAGIYTVVWVDRRNECVVIQQSLTRSNVANVIAVGKRRCVSIHKSEEGTTMLDSVCRVCEASYDPDFIPTVSYYLDLCVAPSWIRGTQLRKDAEDLSLWTFELTEFQIANALAEVETMENGGGHYSIGDWPWYHHCRPLVPYVIYDVFFEYDAEFAKSHVFPGIGCYWQSDTCDCATVEIECAETTSEQRPVKRMPRGHKAKSQVHCTDGLMSTR